MRRAPKSVTMWATWRAPNEYEVCETRVHAERSIEYANKWLGRTDIALRVRITPLPQRRKKRSRQHDR